MTITQWIVGGAALVVLVGALWAGWQVSRWWHRRKQPTVNVRFPDEQEPEHVIEAKTESESHATEVRGRMGTEGTAKDRLDRLAFRNRDRGS